MELSGLAAHNTYTTAPPSHLSWTPSPINCIKINVDTAHFDLKTSIATVALNYDGVVIKVWAKSIS